MDQNNLIQLSNLNAPPSTATPTPDCSNPPKWISPSTANSDIKRFLCHKLLVYDDSRSHEEAWAKVHTFQGDGQGVFAMAEEEWIQLFNLHEGKMIYNAIQMQKQDWEQTDILSGPTFDWVGQQFLSWASSLQDMMSMKKQTSRTPRLSPSPSLHMWDSSSYDSQSLASKQSVIAGAPNSSKSDQQQTGKFYGGHHSPFLVDEAKGSSTMSRKRLPFHQDID